MPRRAMAGLYKVCLAFQETDKQFSKVAIEFLTSLTGDPVSVFLEYCGLIISAVQVGM